MSWSEVKIHKQAAPDMLQSLRFAEADLAVAADCPGRPGDEFQLVQLCQSSPAPAVAPAPPVSAQLREELGGATGPTVREQQEQELNQLLGALATGLGELDRLRNNVLKNSTQDMLRLVLAVAEQVIHCEVKANHEVILSTLGTALQSAINSDEYHVKVHPDDLAVVVENKPLFLASVSGLKNITLEADEKVSRGGCLIESELGQVDASIEGQLEELRQRLQATVADE
ncbi:MAG: flagellar assembly protein FliH [Desulfobacterales bacterium]|nr:flagellar assembly protein FliH [Desulfobacterales bacterium]